MHGEGRCSCGAVAGGWLTEWFREGPTTMKPAASTIISHLLPSLNITQLHFGNINENYDHLPILVDEGAIAVVGSCTVSAPPPYLAPPLCRTQPPTAKGVQSQQDMSPVLDQARCSMKCPHWRWMAEKTVTTKIKTIASVFIGRSSSGSLGHAFEVETFCADEAVTETAPPWRTERVQRRRGV